MAVYGKVSLFVLVLAEAALFLKLEPIYSHFYLFAWWPAIFLADALIQRKSGKSFIVDDTREFVVLCVASVYFWLVFELINVRLNNWEYHIQTRQSVLMEWLTGAACFATVLPGLFFFAHLFRIYTRFGHARIRGFEVTGNLLAGLFAVGCAFFVFPLIWPDYFFPLVWGSFIFLLVPVNALFAKRSLLRDMSRGDISTFYCLLLGGAVCGLLWEFWNFWAPDKWIYTIPYVNKFKVFEMPILGFLGFPPFAVECYVGYNTLSIFRAGKSWEHGPIPGRKGLFEQSAAVRIALIPVLVIVWAVSFSLMDLFTVKY